jgi:hypothetical protein
MVEVAEGSHTVEIRKPGFRPTYAVDVRRGQTTPLNVSLRGSNDSPRSALALTLCAVAARCGRAHLDRPEPSVAEGR